MPLKLFLCLILSLLCSCSGIHKLVKAKPAAFSPFIEHPAQMQRQPGNNAFQFLWRSPDRSAHSRARPLQELYIAPVSLRYLRPMNVGTTKFNQVAGTQKAEEAPQIAAEMRHQFAIALTSAEHPRYRVVSRPGPNSLTLEMAITELNPTQPKMNAAKLAAKIIFGPIGTVGGLAVQSSGNIAMEAKIKLHSTGQLVFQFADNESDKLTFYSIRDFRPFGHVKMAIREWGELFAELTQSRAGTQIDDGFFWTLMPW